VSLWNVLRERKRRAEEVDGGIFQRKRILVDWW